MKNLLTIRNALLTAVLIVLLGCGASPQSIDYSDEVGANGLPTPRALYSRYVTALGGEEKILSIQSNTSRGTFDLAAFGISGDVTIFAAAPNNIKQHIMLGGIGEIETGYNGSEGWRIDPLQGNAMLAGDELSLMADQSDFYLPLHLADVYQGAETVSTEGVNGGQAYRVNATTSTGSSSSLFFSTENGLLVRLDAVAPSPGGDVPTSTYFDEYRAFDGYQVPVSITISQAGQEFTITVDDVTFNDVAAEEFVVPEGI